MASIKSQADRALIPKAHLDRVFYQLGVESVKRHGHNPRIAHHGHEIRIACPAGHDVSVEVAWQTRAGTLAYVVAHVEAMRVYGSAQQGCHVSKQAGQLRQLIDC